MARHQLDQADTLMKLNLFNDAVQVTDITNVKCCHKNAFYFAMVQIYLLFTDIAWAMHELLLKNIEVIFQTKDSKVWKYLLMFTHHCTKLIGFQASSLSERYFQIWLYEGKFLRGYSAVHN